MFAKKTTRTSTTSRLPAATSSDLPAAPAQTTLAEIKPPVPTYEYADRQKGAVDVDTDNKDKQDQAIETAQGKAKDDDRQATTTSRLTKPADKVSNNEPQNQPATTTAATSATPYFPFWNIETDYTFEEEVYERPSFWTPNFLAIVSALQAASQYARENRHMIKNEPGFLDYAVYCYYAVLFYIQILRAQRDSGKIDGVDASFLRRFERRFNPEQLPITNFLVPTFSNITALLLPDERHSWIVPQYGAYFTDDNGNEANELFTKQNGTAQTFRNIDYHLGSCLLQPIVPYMLAVLRTATTPNSQIFTTLTAHQLYDAGAANDYSDTDYPFWTDKDQFIPLSVSTLQADGTNGNIRTRRFSRATMTLNGVNQHDEFARILASPGLNVPVEATPDSLEIASKYWNRTSFNDDINVFAVNTTPTAAPANGNQIRHNEANGVDVTFRSLEEFLLMPKSSNLDWFDALVNNAAVHARFFQGVTNLSQIPTTSGQTPAITAKLVTTTGGRFGQRVNPDAALTTIDRTLAVGWYNNVFKNVAASFFTSRAAPLRSEELQALAFATNASIPYTITVGAAQQRIGAATPSYRSGSFFEEDTFVRRSAAAASENAAKPMFKGWNTMIQTNFALARPTGY